MRTLKFKDQPTTTFFATVNQMFGGSYPASFRLRPTCGNQIVEHSSDNETALGSGRKLVGAVGRLIDGSEERICRLRVRMLLKGAVIDHL